MSMSDLAAGMVRKDMRSFVTETFAIGLPTLRKTWSWLSTRLGNTSIGISSCWLGYGARDRGIAYCFHVQY